MAVTTAEKKIIGYLPNDQPPWGQLILFGLQHVLTMFPATVLVALLVGFDVGAVLTVSGVATVAALLGSYYGAGKFIPLYYGSSFSYIAATVAVTGGGLAAGQPGYAGHGVQVAQVGIVATGIFNILIGIIIRLTGGKASLDKILPASITGPVAMVIGIALGKSALDMANGYCCLFDSQGQVYSSGKWWLIAFITLFVTVAFSVYLQGKGFWGMLPILYGAVAGYIISIPFGMVDFSKITAEPFLRMPHLSLPAFGDPKAWASVGTIAVIAVATIPESTAHLYQIGLYVDELADTLGRDRFNLSELIGLNLILDGLGDLINGMFGGVAGTNYGENNSLMVITRNYSGPALMAAGVIAIILGFIGTLAGIVNSVPTAVMGGLSIYLFGIIGLQGVALMMAEGVDLFDPRQLAIGAVILIIGVGGHIGYGGNLPVKIPYFAGPGTAIFPDGLPAIATAAVVGILINLIFLIFPAPERKRLSKLEEEAGQFGKLG
jgi:uracil permease